MERRGIFGQNKGRVMHDLICEQALPTYGSFGIKSIFMETSGPSVHFDKKMTFGSRHLETWFNY